MVAEDIQMTRFTIGKVAQAAGVGVETIRFYQRRELIDEPRAISSSFREYPEAVVDRIRFIKRAQALGFTLEEIRDLLEFSDAPQRSRQDVKQLAEKKLVAIRQKLVDLQQMEVTLSKLVNQCSGRGSVKGCPIIEAIVNVSDPCHPKER